MNKLINQSIKSLCLSCLLVVVQLSHAATYSISGIQGSLADNVKARLALLEKQNTPAAQELIKKNIVQATAPFGYYSPKIQINKNLITIDKGLPTRIQKVSILIVGPGKALLKRFIKDLKLNTNEIFNSEAFDNAKQTLFNTAEHYGYLNAKMIKSIVTIDKENLKANITIHFSTGNLYYFGPIHFARTTAYKPTFLRRYLTFHQNQPFSTDKLLQLNSALNDSGYFNQISVKPKIDKNIHVPINIYLHDKPAQNYLAGFGYVTDTGFRGRLGSQWLRVNDFGHTFQALYVGSQKQHALQAQYVIPGLNPTTDQYTFSSKIFQLRYPLGGSHAQLFSAASTFQKNQRLYTASLNFLEESFHFTGSDKVIKQVLYPHLRSEYKKVSSPLFSKSGFLLYNNLKLANKNIASDLDLMQVELGAKAAFWLSKSHSRIFLRTSIGLTKIPDIYQLPLSLQLITGGADSIRGYHFQSIGPGKIMRVHSAEIQQETFKDWYLTAFYDIGDVYKPAQHNWKKGAGGGLMWVSPIGPIRLSLAKAFDDKGQPLRVIFSMGPDL